MLATLELDYKETSFEPHITQVGDSSITSLNLSSNAGSAYARSNSLSERTTVSHTTTTSKFLATRHCYGCGETGHLHKDCPRDRLFCYNCNQPGHSSKNCSRPKPWETQNG